MRVSLLVAMLLTTAACSKGGNLTLEPGARRPVNKGSPFVQINQGGKAYMVDTGAFAQGITANVSIQAVSSKSLSSASGHTAVIQKATKAQ